MDDLESILTPFYTPPIYRRQVPLVSTKKLWEEVKKSYDEIRELIGDRKSSIIDFSDLRYRVSCNLQLPDHKKFDEAFLSLMNSKYKKYIYLHGAPTGEYDEEMNFHYKGRLYPYLSLVLK